MIKKLVICAPNIDEGGPLTVLNEATETALKSFPKTNIFIITNNKKLISANKNKRINFLEYPESKKSWLSRIKHEFIIFNKIAKEIDADIWISLQDVTSVINARYQSVYCHCPIPFYQLSLKDIYFEPSSLIRNLLYNFIYRVNIHRNDSVIVQQEWLREKFRNITGHKNIIVAKPIISGSLFKKNKKKKTKKIIFIYPTLPRFHKNIELLCEAIKLIDKKKFANFSLKITIKGNENRYSAFIKRKYSNIKEIKFIGLQSKNKMIDLYKEASALIFPSKLETWGLPISEAANYNLPILVSRLNYSYETLGNYKKVSFFDHEKPFELSQQIENLLNDKWKPSQFKKVKSAKPFASNWHELWEIIKKEFAQKNEN